MWRIPRRQDARFVACMEEVLEVYARPYDKKRPVVCLDEAAKQLLAPTRLPLPLQPGTPERHDPEYVRRGTCSLFMVFEPLAAQRFVDVRERRTNQDYAQVVKWLCDVLYPNVEQSSTWLNSN